MSVLSFVLPIIIILVLLAVAISIILFFIGEIIAEFTTDAPFVPVPKEIVGDIVDILELEEDSCLYDLGCGDGRVLFSAVKKYPSIRAVGVDIAFEPYFIAKFRARNFKNVKIKREDIFKTDMHDATHIFLYLYPQVISNLILNIKKQCKSGTRIVTCDFEIKENKPVKIVALNKSSSVRGKKLFVYIV